MVVFFNTTIFIKIFINIFIYIIIFIRLFLGCFFECIKNPQEVSFQEGFKFIFCYFLIILVFFHAAFCNDFGFNVRRNLLIF